MRKILALSDTHGHLPAIPPCDLLLLAGDYCPGYRRSQKTWLQGPFKNWFNALPAREIVWVGGNHDFALEDASEGLLDGFKGHYLQDSGCDVYGLKIWGTPWTPPFFNWAFMAEDSAGQLGQKFGQIPENTDIVISHGPPYGILDRNMAGDRCGSRTLRQRMLAEVQPRLCVFGHIHEDRGEVSYDGTVFANVSHLDAQYRVHGGAVDFSQLFPDL